MSSFYTDLEKGRRAEQIVLNTFRKLTNKYQFEDVSNNKEYYYKGDIRAIGANANCPIFIEVKNDEAIAKTKNFLCEEEVYNKDGDYYVKGNMSCESNIYCVVSEAERLIYVLDFWKLKEIYKKGEYKVIPHTTQITYCYLLELCRAKQWGALIDIIKY